MCKDNVEPKRRAPASSWCAVAFTGSVKCAVALSSKCTVKYTRVCVDQPVHWCLDTLHRHRLRCKDRPYGGKLSKDIDRISSLFY